MPNLHSNNNKNNMIYTPVSGQAFDIVVKSIAPLETGTGYTICGHGVPGMLFECAITEIYSVVHTD